MTPAWGICRGERHMGGRRGREGWVERLCKKAEKGEHVGLEGEQRSWRISLND